MLSHRVAAIVIFLILVWMSTSGETSPAQQRAPAQARETLAAIEQAASEARGPQRQAWLDRITSRRQEFERSLDWLIESGDGERALRFASAMNVFWTAFGELSRARERLDTVLALPSAKAPTPARARALYDAGLLAFRQNDEVDSFARNEQSLAIGRQLGDKTIIARALIGLSRVALRQHEYELVRRDANEALHLAGQLNDRDRELSAVHMLAAAARMGDENSNAAKYYKLTLGAYGEEGDRAGVAGELMNLGFVHLHLHDSDWALRLFKESIAIYRSLQFEQGLGWNIGGLTAVAVEQHNGPRAARLYGALDTALKQFAIVLDPDDQLDCDRYVAMARAEIGSAAFDAARAEGRQMSISDALALGLRQPE
jgi:hypothetical protein